MRALFVHSGVLDGVGVKRPVMEPAWEVIGDKE